MKLGKIKIATTLALAGAILCGSYEGAQASNIMGFFKNMKASGKTAMCEKGDISKGKITIRSFSGALCDSRSIASFAVKACKNYPGFWESKCATKAKAHGFSPTTSTKQLDKEIAADPELQKTVDESPE